MIPDVTLRFKDGALGILPAETDRIQLVLGMCSAGTVNDLQPIATKDALRTQCGSGPLVEASALKLEIGGGPIYAMRLATATAGTLSTVTSSTGAPAVTVTGTHYDTIDGRVRITAAGPIGTARFQYSLDGGT